MAEDKIRELIDFLREETHYFTEKSADLTYEEFSSNKDLKKILNATLNEIVLALVDLAGESLRRERKRVPTTYKDVILAARSIVGEVALKAAPLAKLRNETIYEYMNVNWKNIQFLRAGGIAIVDEFVAAVEKYGTKQADKKKSPNKNR